MQKKTEDGGCVGAIDPVEGKFGGILSGGTTI